LEMLIDATASLPDVGCRLQNHVCTHTSCH